jgi:hypothetical protein
MSDGNQPLPLDDARWRDLRTRSGVGAEWVPDVVRGLQDRALGSDAFRELWPELCSEDRTYDAAFAVAPYLTGIARGLPSHESLEYLIVLGLIETCAGVVPEDLEAAYRWATQDALAHVLERMADCPVGHELRYLLAAVAAFRGRSDLASALQNLDAIQEACPECGTVVFPAELQQIHMRDAELR